VEDGKVNMGSSFSAGDVPERPGPFEGLQRGEWYLYSFALVNRFCGLLCQKQSSFMAVNGQNELSYDHQSAMRIGRNSDNSLIFY
jgi:hypothetical protein